MRFSGLHALLELRRSGGELHGTPTPAGGPDQEPLTGSQQRLLQLEQSGLGGARLHLEDVFCIEGPLDRDALAAALRGLVQRHEQLRRRYPPPGAPLPAGDPELQVFDVRQACFGLAPEARALHLQALARAFVERPFQLAQEPPLRAALLCVASELHWLVIAVHHIAFDRWSRDIVRRELGVWYAAARRGESPALPALSVRVADLAAWQRSLLQGPAGARLRGFWQDELSTPACSGGLRATPGTDAAPGRESPRASLQRSLPAELVARLRRLANAQDVGLFVPLLAGYALLLAEHGSGQDFLVCTPMAGREDGRLHGLVGYLANIVLLRLRLAGSASRTQLLASVRASVDGASAHQDLPLQALPGLDMRAAPPRSLFAFQNTPGFALQLAGCQVQALALPGGQADFESFFEIVPDGAQLSLHVSYDRARLTHATVEAALERYAQLLAELVESERCPALPGAPEAPASAAGACAAVPRIDAVQLARLAELPRARRELLVCEHVWALLGRGTQAPACETSLQELGVGSLSLLQLLAALERDFGVGLPLSRDLTAITLAQVAERLLDRFELDTVLRRPSELGDAGFETVEL